MRPGLGTTQRVETTLRIDPRVLLTSQLLQLGQMELESAIEAELAENPALERLDDLPEPLHEDRILRAIAPGELSPGSDDREFHRSRPNDETAPDWLDMAAAPPCLRDHLVAQLLPVLPPPLSNLGRYLVECLNERGYLEEPDEEIALATGYGMEDVEAAVRALQSCEPAGVGARDLRECLLLQLRDTEKLEQRLARAILRSCMDDLLHRRTMRLARRYGVVPDLVELAYTEIERLNPFPCEGFRSGGSCRSERSLGIAADLVLSRTEAGWHVEVQGPEPGSLRISRAYQRRQKELAGMERPDRDEKRHVGHFIDRADDFIHCLEQRRRTLRLIGEYLVRHQSGFVATGGYEFLNALTRSRMAAEIGVHESTASRATADKFVQIATGEVVPFEVFFKPALRVQKMIEEILATENPDAPLSDERIAEMLAKKGVSVARRTVNKYRDRTRLLSSRRRRSA